MPTRRLLGAVNVRTSLSGDICSSCDFRGNPWFSVKPIIRDPSLRVDWIRLVGSPFAASVPLTSSSTILRSRRGGRCKRRSASISSSKSGLNLLTEAKPRKAIVEKAQTPQHSSSAIIIALRNRTFRYAGACVFLASHWQRIVNLRLLWGTVNRSKGGLKVEGQRTARAVNCRARNPFRWEKSERGDAPSLAGC